MSTPPQLEGDSLLVDVADGLAVLTLNRPEHHNALSRQLRDNLLVALRHLNEDEEVGVIIITGAGVKAFSAGADLKELETSPLTPDEVGIDCPVMQAFDALRKPVIAAVNGFAVAGGFELAVNCDLIVASSTARFADTHVRVGISPAWGMPQYLAMLIGPVRARYLAYTGNYLDAATARDWGLVLEVLPPEELLDHCKRIAADILSCDPDTLRDVRDAMRLGLRHTVDEGLQLEARFAKRSVQRFDAAGFARRRQAVMSRGKRVSGSPPAPFAGRD